MQMERYPFYKENITIRTWLSKYTTVRAIRENIIFDEQGNIIGRAKGLWLFFDIKRRRPIKISNDIKKSGRVFLKKVLLMILIKKLKQSILLNIVINFGYIDLILIRINT
jgi:acyl-ACP thioesterase